MQLDSSPLCAADISPELKRRFAFLSGESLVTRVSSLSNRNTDATVLSSHRVKLEPIQNFIPSKESENRLSRAKIRADGESMTVHFSCCYGDGRRDGREGRYSGQRGADGTAAPLSCVHRSVRACVHVLLWTNIPPRRLRSRRLFILAARRPCANFNFPELAYTLLMFALKPFFSTHHRCLAVCPPGGRGDNGSPVIIFPEFPTLGEITDREFHNVLTYLTSVPR